MATADAAKLAQLAEPLRSRLSALLRQAGDSVWIVSGRRSVEEQAQLRRAHCGSTFYDIWQKPASQCSPPTAIPGRSKHNTGLAADLGGNLELAERLAGPLGLNTPVSGEPWHFEVAGAQALTGTDIPGPIDDVVEDVFGAGQEAVEDVVGSVLGSLVEPFLGGLRRIALVGVLVAGGVTLVVLGGTRGTRTQGAL